MTNPSFKKIFFLVIVSAFILVGCLPQVAFALEPTCKLSVRTEDISSGKKVTLTWATTEAARLALYKRTLNVSNLPAQINISAGTVAAGSVIIDISETTTFDGIVFRADNTGFDCNVVTVTVDQPPSCNLTASPTTVPTGGADVVLSWTLNNAVIIDITGGNADIGSTRNGNRTIRQTGTVTYTGTVTSSSGVERTCTVTVRAQDASAPVTPTPPPTLTPTPSPTPTAPATSGGPLDGPLVPTCFASQNGGFVGACQLCDLVKLAKNLINFAIAFSVIAATLLFAYAGFMYYTAASSPENIKKAHGIFTKTLGGIVLILAAWLVVDILMQTITRGTWALSADIQCMTYPRGASLPPTPVRGGATGTGTRTCDSPTSGLCSVSSMGGFGDQANQAAAVCLAESGARATPRTNTDILLNDAQRRPFSFGLFQINATVHRLTAPECTPSGRGTHECPSAFACPNNAERCNSNQKLIVNEDVYNRCAQSLRNTACNIATAQQIWGASGRNFSTDWTAARRCGIR